MSRTLSKNLVDRRIAARNVANQTHTFHLYYASQVCQLMDPNCMIRMDIMMSLHRDLLL